MACTSLGDFVAKEEYLTQVYHRDERTAEIEYHSDLGGRLEFESVFLQLYIGEEKFSAGMEILHPLIPYRDRRDIFVEGSRFRQIFRVKFFYQVQNFFAGAGKFNDRTDGSPLIALKVIYDVLTQKQSFKRKCKILFH